MKKIVALAMSACLLLAMTACSGGTPNDNSGENADGNTGGNFNTQTETKEMEMEPAEKEYIEILDLNFYSIKQEEYDFPVEFPTVNLGYDETKSGYIHKQKDEANGDVLIIVGAPGSASVDTNAVTMEDIVEMCNSTYKKYHNREEEYQINNISIKETEDIVVNNIEMRKVTGNIVFEYKYNDNEFERQFIGYYFFGGKEHNKPVYVLGWTKTKSANPTEKAHKQVVIPDDFDSVIPVAEEFVKNIERADNVSRDEAMYAKILEYPNKAYYSGVGYNFNIPFDESSERYTGNDEHLHKTWMTLWNTMLRGKHIFSPTLNTIYVISDSSIPKEPRDLEGAKAYFLEMFASNLSSRVTQTTLDLEDFEILKDELVNINGIDMYYLEGRITTFYGATYDFAGYFVPKDLGEHGIIPNGIIGCERLDSRIAISREVTDLITKSIEVQVPKSK